MDKDYIYVLTACGIFEHNWYNFNMRLVSHKLKKIREFKTRGVSTNINLEECEVKSTCLRNSRERERNSFLKHLNGDELREISELYYSSLSEYNMVLYSVVIDKRYLEPHYDRVKLHRKAWELLCERIVRYIYEEHPKHKVILVKDDVSTQENADLARKHSWLLANGTSANVKLKPIVEMPLFTKSNLNEGLQLADLCSYNIYKAFRYDDFGYNYFRNLLPFFCRSKKGFPIK